MQNDVPLQQMCGYRTVRAGLSEIFTQLKVYYLATSLTVISRKVDSFSKLAVSGRLSHDYLFISKI